MWWSDYWLIQPFVFIGNDTYNGTTLKCCASGLKDKPECETAMGYFLQFDLAWVSEVKSAALISLQGFVVDRAIDKTCEHSGGLIALVKHCLVPNIKSVYIDCVRNIMCIELTESKDCVPGLLYISTSNSPYFDLSIFWALQSLPLDTWWLKWKWKKKDLDDCLNSCELSYDSYEDTKQNKKW